MGYVSLISHSLQKGIGILYTAPNSTNMSDMEETSLEEKTNRIKLINLYHSPYMLWKIVERLVGRETCEEWA